ncbi:hypothetical protein GGF46_000994 [Coemansia sp. RSA 552]|nr:hypothetical protein GGF46_000994 [Coemansia sp. RSA 552]
MEPPPPKPLLKYAEELLQSYSRLIVHSGDILRALPEPHSGELGGEGGLSVANIKTKKDESTAFLREWQHLESILDEYLIRLNDTRSRAHEELDAAKVRCLAGENIDLTLPEAAVKLGARLSKYKRQYDALQAVVGGGSVADVDDVVEPPVSAAEEGTVGEQTQGMEVDTPLDQNEKTPATPADLMPTDPTETQEAQEAQNIPAATQASEPADPDPDTQEIINIDVIGDDDDDEPIDIESGSEIDDDEAMEQMFH